MADDIAVNDTRNVSPIALAGAATLRLLALLGFGLMLGACSKCDVPNWQHSSAGAAPAACHSEPSPQ
jgi:hypothetical protein